MTMYALKAHPEPPTLLSPYAQLAHAIRLSTYRHHQRTLNFRIKSHSPGGHAAASSKSLYRKCPGGKHSGAPLEHGAGALVDRALSIRHPVGVVV